MRKKKRSSVDRTEGIAAPLGVPKEKKSRASDHSKATRTTDASESLFDQFVREAGVTLKYNGTANEISADQNVFQKRLQRCLKKNPRYPNVIQEFITGLESHIEDAERFRNSLLPCVPRLSEEDSTSASYQETLMRLLLGIEILQSAVVNTLLEKLPEFMFEGTGEDGLNVPRVIINQLKWLDRVVDSKDLASKLMQLVSVAPVEIQREVITSLPEILEDSQHGDIAKELNSLLQENTQLTVPILDALSSLNLSAMLLAEVRGAVMATLSAVQLEDLPVVVKFILHSISASDASEVVSDLRKKLDLGLCVLPPVLQASQSRTKTKSTAGGQDSISLILDVIKSAVRFQKFISEAWLKAIENVEDAEDHKVIDLLVLFILHSTNANLSRRGVERLLKVKVRGCLIQEAVLQKTFRGHGQVLRSYFPSILALAQNLLRSTDCSVFPFGGHMYKHAFTSFDSYCQQEVVGSLVTHVCSGVAGEVDMALELLCELVAEKTSEMVRYAVLVKGILDYMDNMSSQQIRRLFHLLSTMAFSQDHQGGHIQDDMHIVIRKQLSSTVPKYKRIGIIGAVMIVGSMGARRDSQTACLCLRQVTTLLELVRSCSEVSPEAAALYYDEMANMVLTSKLDPLVQSVLEDFQEDFVVDLGPEISGSFPLPASVMYNLDEDESEGGIAINLLPLLAGDISPNVETTSQRVDKMSPLYLASFFRLLRLCEEEQHQGDLEEIDALLGCPLILTDMDVIEKFDSLSKTEKEFLCSLLFYTINWFREVVNAFCQQKDPEMKMKVVTRLQNITYLQTLLERSLAAMQNFVPPLANFDCDNAEMLVPPSSAAPSKKGKKESTGKKRKVRANKNSSGDASQLEEVAEAEESQQKESRPGISLSSYRPFFRELDMEVLSVIQCGLLSRSLLDTEMNSETREEVQLGPAELVFLLEDMWRKLEFSLSASTAKKGPFFKGKVDRTVGFSHLQQKRPREVATYCIELLPTLCTHLENCHNHFQVGQNLLKIDQEHQLMSTAYNLLLQVFLTNFSWSVIITMTMFFHYCYIISRLNVICEFLSTLARQFLCQEWVTASGEKERGNKHNDTLHSLLSIYLNHIDDVLKAVEEIAGQGIPELMNTSKDGSSTTWPTLNRQTFLVYYKCMMAELEKAVHKIPPGKQQDNNEVQSEKLLTWNLAVRDFHILINLVKVCSHGIPNIMLCVLMCFVQYGRLFLECFLKLGMPLLDYSFKKHKEDVQGLLKTIQLSTRQLHHMCGHSKICQDTGLTNHVPALKKSLELFVYRVKAMLTLNHCQEAFWLGNLKNRDLKGEEILSQRSQETDEDEDEEEHEQDQSEQAVLLHEIICNHYELNCIWLKYTQSQLIQSFIWPPFSLPVRVCVCVCVSLYITGE
uniref:FA complementation group D2 n=1 Tax=Denticeps clupeoides TaxID=299321 RepID=A0AAY4DYS6_9TELE